MTIPLSTIKTELRRWLETASGYSSNRVIFAFENAPQLSGAYIHVWPTLSISPVGAFDEVGEVDDDGEVITKSYRHVVGFIQAFGTGSNQILSTCQDALSNPIYQAFWKAAELAIQIEPIIDQTALKGRNYEERCRMEFKILCGSEVTDDLGWFNRVEVGSNNLDFNTFTIEN